MKTYIDKTTEKLNNKIHQKDDNLVKLYALLVLTKGNNVTLKDVHDAWAMNMNFKKTTPVCYGHEHKSIVPFEELSVETQVKDRKFLKAIKETANELCLGESNDSYKDNLKNAIQKEICGKCQSFFGSNAKCECVVKKILDIIEKS